MDLSLLAPEIALVLLALAIIGLDLYIPDKRVLAYATLLGLLVPAVLALSLVGYQTTSFAGTLIVDPFAVFFKLLFLGAAAIVVLSSVHYAEQSLRWRGEYYALVLFATVGMMLMAAAGDLITVYIALETASISLYVLAGFRKGDPFSGEAALKYLLLGALASAVLLYGMALLYGLTGTTVLAQVGQRLSAPGVATSPIALLALALVVAGFGFKIAAVPFQMWAPDVYQGAPTPVTAFLSVASKASGFAVLLRVVTSAFGPLQADWQAMFAALAVVTMFVGNLAAIPQRNIKRMMGYSSIAMAGYLLVGMAALAGGNSGSILLFLAAYTVTNLGAFAAIIAFSNQVGSDEIEDYAGLAARSPLLALAFAFCLFSLIGIPPLAGFFGKFYVFAEAYGRGLGWLVLIGLINSAISMYYYLRVVKVMYLNPAVNESRVRVPAALATALGVTSVGVVILGIGISQLMYTAQVAAQGLIR